MVPAQATRRAAVPYLILAAALILTAVATLSAARTYSARDRLRFENAAERVKAAVVNRLDSYIAMLLGGAGLFAASDDVSFEEFQRYVERLELRRRYPGIQGIGFSRVIPPEEREAIAAQIRRHVPTFRYWPEKPGSIHAIVYLEPQDARNEIALGYDMFAEPTRNAAMTGARDTAAPAASGRVFLVQENLDQENRQPGFLIYVPVYQGGDIPATVEERRKLLRGFVYSPFRAYDLLDGILGSSDLGEVAYDLYDGRPGEHQALLVHAPSDDPLSGRFETVRQLDIAGRPWTLELRSGPAFARTSGHMLVWFVAGGGLAFSVLLFVVTQTQVRARACRTNGGGVAGDERGAERGEPCQGRVPRHRVPRAPHPAERDRGVDGHAPAGPRFRGEPEARDRGNRAERGRADAPRRRPAGSLPRRRRPAAARVEHRRRRGDPALRRGRGAPFRRGAGRQPVLRCLWRARGDSR